MDKPTTRRSAAQKSDKESNLLDQVNPLSQSEISEAANSASASASKPIILEQSQTVDDDNNDLDSDRGHLHHDDNMLDFAADNNNRFALILEKMDLLEKENQILKARNLSHENNENKQKRHIEETYEREIKDTRELLDTMAETKANMELDLARLDHDLKDQKAENFKNLTNFNKVKNELDALKEASSDKDRKFSEMTRDFSDLKNNFKLLSAENKKILDERKTAFTERDLHENDAKKLRADNNNLKNKVADFESKIAALKKEVDETRKSCQDEALKRVNCENQIATLTETLDFERKVSKERIEEFSSGPGESFNAKVELGGVSRTKKFSLTFFEKNF